MIEFTTEPFTVKTKEGSQTVPAIHCGNGIFIHRPIFAPEQQTIDKYYNPFPIWTISAKCGMKIKDCFIPHIAFNELLSIIEKQLCTLDWTKSFDEIVNTRVYREAASLFLCLIMPISDIDFQTPSGEKPNQT
ncbi:MAG: hypothetical protein WC769_01470 [Thermodesulfovibrionales bacterium]|jgi:hypothetical protein